MQELLQEYENEQTLKNALVLWIYQRHWKAALWLQPRWSGTYYIKLSRFSRWRWLPYVQSRSSSSRKSIFFRRWFGKSVSESCWSNNPWKDSKTAYLYESERKAWWRSSVNAEIETRYACYSRITCWTKTVRKNWVGEIEVIGCSS